MKILWDGIGDALIGIFLALDSFVYSLVSSAYKIFMSLASARILSSDAYTEIANKIYIIIGVLMLFVLAYAIIKGIIDPDQMTKGEMGGPKIVKSVIVAVIGLAIAPVVFNILYQAQGLFLEKDVIANIFFRSADDSYSFGNVTLDGITEDGAENAGSVSVNVGDVEYNKEIKNIGGAITALETFKPFFRPYGNTCDEMNIDNCDSNKSIADQIVADPKEYYVNSAVGLGLGCAAGIAVAVAGFAASIFTFGTSLVIAGVGGLMCRASVLNASEASKFTYDDEVSLSQAYVYAAESGDFSIFRIFTDNVQEGEISYSFLISTIFGAFICYVFVSFCIDMGMRAGKLAYYQIIAPIPLIMQILPKFKDSFKKYVSSVISTFMEVFIRISVVYIIVYIICHVNDMFSNVFSVGDSGLSWFEGTIAVALLIVGLVLFAKSAPKLISDTFGIQGGSLSFGIGKKLAEGEVFTAGALVGGAVTSGVRNLTNKWGNKENWNNANGKRTFGSVMRNVGSGLVSGVAGTGSAAVRGLYGRATSHKPVANSHDMRNIASKTAQETARARQRREELHEAITSETSNIAQQRGHAAPTGYDRLTANAAVRTQGVRDSISAWAWGTIDTSDYDARNRLYSDMNSLESNLETTYFKDEACKNAERRVEDLKNVTADDYAFTEFLRRRARKHLFDNDRQVVEQMLAKNAEESDSDYAARVERFLKEDESNLTAAEITKRNEYLTKVNQEAELIRNDNNHVAYFSRNDYSVDRQSVEYQEAQAKLNKDRKKADDAFRDAKKEFVARRLAEAAATGVENDVSRTLREFMVNHQTDLRKYGATQFVDNMKLEDYMRQNFGENILIDGNVNLDTIVAGSKADYAFEVEDSTGRKIKVNYSNGKYDVRDSNGHSIMSSVDGTRLREYMQQERYNKITSSLSSSSHGKVVGVTGRMKDDAEVVGDNLRKSAEYIDAKRRQQKAQEQKNNSNK